jgi:hypothetical protein
MLVLAFFIKNKYSNFIIMSQLLQSCHTKIDWH